MWTCSRQLVTSSPFRAAYLTPYRGKDEDNRLLIIRFQSSKVVGGAFFLMHLPFAVVYEISNQFCGLTLALILLGRGRPSMGFCHMPLSVGMRLSVACVPSRGKRAPLLLCNYISTHNNTLECFIMGCIGQRIILELRLLWISLL